MSSQDSSVPVTRLELRRMTPSQLVLSDPELNDCSFLRVLGKDAQIALLDAGTTRRFEVQSHVFKQGDSAESVFLILRGDARLLLQQGQTAAEFGGVRKGDLVGEVELVRSQTERAFSVVAVSELHVVEWPNALVRELARNSHPLRDHLVAEARRRNSARDEMSVFLGRW